MMTRAVKVSLDVPDEIPEAHRADAERKAHEAAVLSLWEAGDVSTRQAATELGLTYYDYLDLLAARGIPVERGALNVNAIEEAGRKLAEGRP